MIEIFESRQVGGKYIFYTSLYSLCGDDTEMNHFFINAKDFKLNWIEYLTLANQSIPRRKGLMQKLIMQ